MSTPLDIRSTELSQRIGAPAPADARVSVRGLRVRYAPDAPFVLDGVDLDVHAGEVVALLGSSGSGKSTLMKAMTGFAPIVSGTATVGDVDVAHVRGRRLRALRAQVGQVFQQFNLIGRLPVLTNVLTGSLHDAGPLNLLGTFRSADRARALELLDRVGIAHKANDEARSLSGGQQQRVAIARALMQNPRVILADEPVASLDPAMSRTVLELLQSIARDEGIPVLVSLHVVPLALAHSDRIVGLRAGRVEIEGCTADLDESELASVYTDPARRS
ncbi:ATP-binding cassette domain-containing protein [Rhodococcus sp. HNM0569]|uniref:phosphonate ABC transporter ATP-binding protein n=1 Tax=Rhodococcus sp. HNM0569 TaxID=2716340 RepID=UPI00146BEE98|nr:ATP-binding cassette domain-containing protein [Rhodococcus sp. HNM0569]NLU83609.1 ATP-binding cassette domain-containing protein [Rhodococcus sp. HNM0569]